ncbi:hypothetical protein FCM35_KLT10597 [Carex littledalei]|uniref:Transmembrane protein n=1 Tax=Carex littledalei TaxID=544730 RepID=A0A833V554_9POAL|nr:hypothetical protein FCM35_KLT10597 [Carex littledalei]
MEGGAIALPVLGIVAAAAATFYVISFMEIREKSLEALDDLDDDGRDEFESRARSRDRRARTKAQRKPKK